MMGFREDEDPLFHNDLDKCAEEFQAAFDGELWDQSASTCRLHITRATICGMVWRKS